MPIRRPATSRACTCRIPKSSPPSSPATRLLLDDGKVRLVATEVDEQAHRHPRRGRRQIVGPQGREPARHHGADLGAGREGPLRSRGRARRRHRLGGALLHPAAGRHRRGQEDHARPRRRHGQDREAAGRASARRDHGSRRRADGGARRSRRRDAARKGAGRAKADDARGAARRQAGRGRDPDARIHDHEPGPDPRRGVGRRRPPSSKAPMRSCCRPNPRPGNIRSRRSPP